MRWWGYEFQRGSTQRPPEIVWSIQNAPKETQIGRAGTPFKSELLENCSNLIEYSVWSPIDKSAVRVCKRAGCARAQPPSINRVINFSRGKKWRCNVRAKISKLSLHKMYIQIIESGQRIDSFPVINSFIALESFLITSEWLANSPKRSLDFETNNRIEKWYSRKQLWIMIA